MSAPSWFTEQLGWKRASAKASDRCRKLFGDAIGPNLADLSGTSSTRIAGELYDLLEIPKTRLTDFDIGAIESTKNQQSDGLRDDGPTKLKAAGSLLEARLEQDLKTSLCELDSERGWMLTRRGGAHQFAQYEHLQRLQELFETNLTLKSTVGRDYQVSTDVMVGLPNGSSAEAEFSLHAAVSSKLTIRSDRVQNIRFEFGTLVRNRRGRLPHLVVVTAEPLPSRLVSIGRGTGEIDSVYHLLFDEMNQALVRLNGENTALTRQASDWFELVETRRIRPYSELARTLAMS